MSPCLFGHIAGRYPDILHKYMINMAFGENGVQSLMCHDIPGCLPLFFMKAQSQCPIDEIGQYADGKMGADVFLRPDVQRSNFHE